MNPTPFRHMVYSDLFASHLHQVMLMCPGSDVLSQQDNPLREQVTRILWDEHTVACKLSNRLCARRINAPVSDMLTFSLYSF